jgi:riboflavin kinase/FMN adenylyltransferase
MTRVFTVIRDQTPASAIPKGAVVAMGNFDGVHLGHRAVIAAALDMGKAHGRPALALTFEPHPRRFFSPTAPQFRLTDETSKLRLLAGTGLAGAVIMTFDKARAGTTAQDFIHHELVERLGISGIAVGYDFHFGKGRLAEPFGCGSPKARHRGRRAAPYRHRGAAGIVQRHPHRACGRPDH